MNTTSTTLLRAIGGCANSSRWGEFVERYQPTIEGFVRARFPMAECEDVVQETFAAVVRAIPDYHYDPDRKGCFHNWLLGIARHKAEEQVRRMAKDANKLARYGEELVSTPNDRVAREDWRKDAMEVALQQLLADDSYSSQSREIFRRVAVFGESPESVAELFGVTRNNVDQIRSRMMRKLKELVGRVTDV